MTQARTVIQEAELPMASAAPSTTTNKVSGYRRRAASGSVDRTTRAQGTEEGSSSTGT
ncbi:hypothetical protein [Streptomyces sp. NPDC005078]|uniref:hypothetical protein n=1 Tax=unclassified Streptomyces TaxID=2593676 RepID=UPI0033B4BFA6